MITSRDCTSPPRQALAPNASACAHSTGAGFVPEQEQSCRGIGAGELAHLGQLHQGAEVEDRDVWTVSPQHDADSPVLHIGSDNQEARITLDQLAQPPGEEIVEVSEDYGDGGM